MQNGQIYPSHCITESFFFTTKSKILFHSDKLCHPFSKPIQLSILTSIIFTGLFIGSFVWGSIGDQIGRRKGLITTLSINAAFGLLSALSNSYSQLVIFRFLSGLGVGGSIPLIWSYASEISPTQEHWVFSFHLGLIWTISLLQ